jgi:glutamate-1-semialdehyde 2,1-aminomutase
MTSQELFEKARQVIPGGVNSPVRSFKHVGRSPIYFDRGDGAYLFDVEGKSYIDFCMAFGPHILGHSPKVIIDTIKTQAEKALSFGACHTQELDFAQLVLKSYPFLQKVRMVTSGTEAVMTALRLARGFTGRNKVLKFEGCFHGHSDTMLAKAGSGMAELAEADSKGVPHSLVSDTLICRYDSLDEIKAMFERHGSEIAAVIFEPIPANYGLWVPEYAHIRAVTELARTHGALSIFDEVITGFRLGLGGATGYYDLRPDLVTLGKVIGGGLPLAAVAGRGEIMDKLAPVGEVYQAGTMAGNALAIAAGCAVLEELFRRKPEWSAFDKRSEAFAGELQSILKKDHDVQVKSLGSIFWIHFGSETKSFPPQITSEGAKTYAAFFKRAVEEGIYLAPSPYEVGFVSFAHDDKVLAAALEKFKKCSPPR